MVVGVATRDLFPRFFLSGIGGLQSVHASDFFNWESRLLELGPSITWPVFSGGRIRANVALQTAAQEELLAAYREAVLRAFQEVEDALAAFSDQQAARDQLEAAVRANQRATELAHNLYAQGLTDCLTVLVAQVNLLTTQDSLARTEGAWQSGSARATGVTFGTAEWIAPASVVVPVKIARR